MKDNLFFIFKMIGLGASAYFAFPVAGIVGAVLVFVPLGNNFWELGRLSFLAVTASLLWKTAASLWAMSWLGLTAAVIGGVVLGAGVHLVANILSAKLEHQIAEVSNQFKEQFIDPVVSFFQGALVGALNRSIMTVKKRNTYKEEFECSVFIQDNIGNVVRDLSENDKEILKEGLLVNAVDACIQKITAHISGRYVIDRDGQPLLQGSEKLYAMLLGQGLRLSLMVQHTYSWGQSAVSSSRGMENQSAPPQGRTLSDVLQTIEGNFHEAVAQETRTSRAKTPMVFSGTQAGASNNLAEENGAALAHGMQT